MNDSRNTCPVTSFERGGADYAARVDEWLANPHAAFKAFGPEARAFQKRHPSERLRTMTLVAPAEELGRLRPVCVCVDRRTDEVSSWEDVFVLVMSRLLAAHERTFEALQRADELAWLGVDAAGKLVSEAVLADEVQPTFSSHAEMAMRVQWLFLMCGIRLNEVIVQVDPYTEEEWEIRRDELARKRAADKAFMEGRRAAQKAWRLSHPEEDAFGE